MTLHELDTVVLERDLPTHGLRRGDVGAVVHVHSPTAVEVEFVRASGHTQALVAPRRSPRPTYGWSTMMISWPFAMLTAPRVGLPNKALEQAAGLVRRLRRSGVHRPLLNAGR